MRNRIILFALLVGLSVVQAGSVQSQAFFIRGDVDCNGVVDDDDLDDEILD